jgi:hypothetical protein
VLNNVVLRGPNVIITLKFVNVIAVGVALKSIDNPGVNEILDIPNARMGIATYGVAKLLV